MNPVSAKAAAWTDNETKVLIKLWQSHFIEMRKSTRNVPIFRKISFELEKYGYIRTAKQVATKIDNLTQKYKRTRRTLRGKDTKTHTWIYYNDIHSFLGEIGYSVSKNPPLSDEDMRSVTDSEIYPNRISNCHAQPNLELIKVDSYPPALAFCQGTDKGAKVTNNTNNTIPAENAILKTLNELVNVQKEFVKNSLLSQKIEQSLLREQIELQRQSVYTQQRLLEVLEQSIEQEEKSS